MREEIALRKMRSGDPSGLESIMNRYIPYVSVIVWNILGKTMSEQDAEEVVSDVFLAAWEQASDITPGCVKAWLGAVARNKAKNKLRSFGRELPLEEDYLDIPDDADPAGKLELAEQRRLVRQALDTLSEPDRQIFLRHYYYAQTVQQISVCMHLNESTIKTKLRRGRIRLKELLTRWDVK